MATLQILLPLPPELRNRIYGYLCTSGPGTPKTAAPTFKKKTFTISRTTTTILPVSTYHPGLLGVTEAREAEEYASWIQHCATELHVSITFEAVLPAQFDLALWVQKMHKSLQKTVNKFPFIRRVPRRIWVDWNAEVRSLGKKKDVGIGALVKGLVEPFLEMGGQDFPAHWVGVCLSKRFTTVAFSHAISYANLGPLMTLGKPEESRGTLELGIYAEGFPVTPNRPEPFEKMNVIGEDGILRLDLEKLDKMTLTKKIQWKRRGMNTTETTVLGPGEYARIMLDDDDRRETRAGWRLIQLLNGIDNKFAQRQV